MTSAPGLLRHVNPLQGTDSHHGFSAGNTLPLVALPFGMNHWSAQTAEGRWFFSPRDRKLRGVRCTHQPSPWMGDYGAFTVMPQSGHRRLSGSRRAEAYRPEKSVWSPHYFQTELMGSGTKLSMAPTERGAVFEFEFPIGADSRIIIEPASGESFVQVLEDRRTIVGFTRGNAGGVPDGFAHHFVAVVDRPITEWCAFRDDVPFQTGAPETGDRVGICVELGAGDGRPVTLRLATSFIDADQAMRNLELEIGKFGLAEITDRAAAVWESTLGQIEVSDEDPEAVRTFYSCLYRTQLFPRIWHEPAADGSLRHRSPYDGAIHEGILYTDNGFWDTYRTEYPLLGLLNPGRLTEILQGWVHSLREGGWFPQWATPGYRACMVGTHIDAVFADAVARGVTGFDLADAYQGLLKHADTPGDPDGAFGRIGIEDYQQLGYVSTDHHESVARALDYAYDDWCIAQVARALGDEESAIRLEQRSKNYSKMFDPSVGFMRGRNADGTWLEPWDEFHWGSPYVEGGPWQSSWAVPHDPAGLIELMGGEEAFLTKLDQLLSTPPRFTVGPYGGEIHEMTEMACADFGQYAHSNQPVHHVLYLYAAAGSPGRTESNVRRVLAELYSPDILPGDEDNGEMAAWYVLSALGLFPLCPGHPSWTLGSPKFRRAAVHLPNGQDLVVEAPENSERNVYVAEVSLDGASIGGATLSHDQVAAGGHLHFAMTAIDPGRTIAVGNRPYSLSAD